MEELNSSDPKIINEVTKALFVQEILLIMVSIKVEEKSGKLKFLKNIHTNH